MQVDALSAEDNRVLYHTSLPKNTLEFCVKNKKARINFLCIMHHCSRSLSLIGEEGLYFLEAVDIVVISWQRSIGSRSGHNTCMHSLVESALICIF